MAINIESISEEIFKILKGNGHQLQLFTSDGTKTVDPSEATRFYITDRKIMINVSSDDDKTSVEINISPSTEVKSIRGMLDSIRALTARTMTNYTLRTFGKEIHPRDFAYQAKRERETQMKSVAEGFSRAYGSSKSSYQTLENARLVIRHKKSVDEDVRGSRSRNIQSLFIENADGERFKFPNNNLQAARALTRHVKEGGTPYDGIGTHIISLSEELSQLRKFSSYVTKNSLLGEGTNDVYEGVKARIQNIKENFKAICSTRGYRQFTEQFKETTNEIAEEEISDIRNQFTVQMFDENVADALPHVARIVNEISSKEKMLGRFKELVNKVKSLPSIDFRSELDSTDPDYPENINFADGVSELAAWAGYLEKYIKDDQLSNMVSNLSSDIPDLPEEYQIMAAKLLTFIRNHANIDQIKADEATTSVVAESVNYITSSFDELSDIAKIL